ncbi:hypothetical protein HCN44_007955 [Aphidius gifuensis]|uniref:Small ribosomal subunit protein uS2 n=1 Tax=Aphidius gifuensis TaxID=684658 RepID=A0A834XR03_APHGI|nr:40S ribosomal protein SA-like [Aphidius gifuensis]KAF7989281.1 hypothetical protein HCN44_007955 [Aphidius gifuensis]
MSGGIEALQLKEEDVVKMLAAKTHIGSENVNYQMEQYVYKRRIDGAGVSIINLRRTWEKIQLAARAIVAIEHPAEVFAISSWARAQRAVLKFAAHTGATGIAGRFTPGAFTNQIQAAFREPRLLIINDPVTDHQPITEASYVNIPVIAFCNTDSPLRFVDIAIPCNTKSHHSIGLMWWFLAREVLRLRGSIARETKWNVVVDLYFYRDPEEVEKEEEIKEIAAPPQKEYVAEPVEQGWGNESEVVVPAAENWADDSAPVAPVVQAPVVPSEDWSAPAETAAPAVSASQNWGGSSAEKWD